MDLEEKLTYAIDKCSPILHASTDASIGLFITALPSLLFAGYSLPKPLCSLLIYFVFFVAILVIEKCFRKKHSQRPPEPTVYVEDISCPLNNQLGRISPENQLEPEIIRFGRNIRCYQFIREIIKNFSYACEAILVSDILYELFNEVPHKTSGEHRHKAILIPGLMITILFLLENVLKGLIRFPCRRLDNFFSKSCVKYLLKFSHIMDNLVYTFGVVGMAGVFFAEQIASWRTPRFSQGLHIDNQHCWFESWNEYYVFIPIFLTLLSTVFKSMRLLFSRSNERIKKLATWNEGCIETLRLLVIFYIVLEMIFLPRSKSLGDNCENSVANSTISVTNSTTDSYTFLAFVKSIFIFLSAFVGFFMGCDGFLHYHDQENEEDREQYRRLRANDAGYVPIQTTVQVDDSQTPEYESSATCFPSVFCCFPTAQTPLPSSHAASSDEETDGAGSCPCPMLL